VQSRQRRLQGLPPTLPTRRATLLPEEANRLCGQKRRARTGKAVDDDVAAVRHVEERVLEQSPRLHCRVEIEALARVGPQGRASGVGPDIGAPAPVPSKLDVVDVGRVALLEDRQELVLRT